MGTYIRIALRNIFREKKRTFSLGITFTIIGFILILVFSFTNGVGINFKKNFTQAFFGDLTFFGFEKNGNNFKRVINDNRMLKDLIENEFPGSRTIIRVSASFRVYNKGMSKMVDISGIDIDQEQKTLDNLTIIDGSWKNFLNDKASVIISQRDAEYLELNVGDQVLGSVKTYTGAYNTLTFNIAGIYRSSNLLLSSQSFGHLGYIKENLNFPEDSSEQFLVYFDNSKENTLALKLKIQELLKKNGVQVIDRVIRFGEDQTGFMKIFEDVKNSDKNGSFYFILSIDEVMTAIERVTSVINTVALVIGLVLFIIIGVALFVNIRMTINNRMVEIGTLRTIGMSKPKMVSMFLTENLLLGTLFTLFGYILGIVVIILLSTTLNLSHIYEMQIFLNAGHLFFVIKPLQMLGLLGLIVLLTYVFAYIPSRYAGSIRPVDALRREF